jgi:hypothetical protein
MRPFMSQVTLPDMHWRRDAWQQREERIAASLEHAPASPSAVLASLPMRSLPDARDAHTASSFTSSSTSVPRAHTRARKATLRSTWGVDGVEDGSDHGWGSDVSSNDSTDFVAPHDAGARRTCACAGFFMGCMTV